MRAFIKEIKKDYSRIQLDPIRINNLRKIIISKNMKKLFIVYQLD